MKIVLYNPDIPQNTGNIGRTCVALNAELILVRPLGFSLLDKFIKRAGMDYWDKLRLFVVDSLEEACEGTPQEKIFYLSTKGKRYYANERLPFDGVYVFGSESKGLPESFLQKNESRTCFLPMVSDTRSLNLATSVGIVAYEVVRQNQQTFFSNAQDFGVSE